MTRLKQKRLSEITTKAGRGGCGILAVADLQSPPSRTPIDMALDGLQRMEHRGGALDDMGDGAGLLFSPDRSCFERYLTPGRNLPSPTEPLMVGTLFFLHGERNIHDLKREISAILRRVGLAPLGWRKVPVNPAALGRRASVDVPIIFQVFVGKGHRLEDQLFEATHQAKITIEESSGGVVNVVSLAPYTTVYKALATARQLRDFYPDLTDPAMKTNVVIAHRRFSTNTFSNWNLAQPFRHIAHNGEINTITANCRAVSDAQSAIKLGSNLMIHGSDSAQLDRVAEMMATHGMNGIHEALRRMIPPAWREDITDERARRFFEGNERALGTLGAWEGPIALVATDGQYLTAILDRMGLRPLRYVLTTEKRLIVSSEVGACPVPNEEILEDGQLEPGSMILADLRNGEFLHPERSTEHILKQTGLNFENLSTVDLRPIQAGKRSKRLEVQALNAFGWTREKARQIRQMAAEGREPIFSMGNDSPLAVFSENHSRLYSFLHQIVAVVTNPPIDPIREGGAINTSVFLGRSPRLTKKSKYEVYPQYVLPHPFLTNEALEEILASDSPGLSATVLDATFEDTGESRELVRRIHNLTEQAIETVHKNDTSILVVSDFEATHSKRLPLPMLLVVSAMHQALAAKGLRREVSLVVETAEVHEGHDAAVLLAYGATALNPYAMFHVARDESKNDAEKATANIVKTLESTLRRVMSKMGITTLSGYRGSALFEAIGLSPNVVEYFIPDTFCCLGGIRVEEIYQDIVARKNQQDDALVSNRNVVVFDKPVTDSLQFVARHGNSQGDYDRLVQLLSDKPPVYLRDLLDFTAPPRRIAITEVASADDIIAGTIRGAAMSHGAINATAHRAIAAAFNHFHSMSNCGEGGEDERRNPGGEYESDRSLIRQIASGRFGVDATYLSGADEIEIKIGQGAKPGEGGHLPGQKVTAEIAAIRKTQEGVPLISPPPHHDIYSIEDLAQLIGNLRQLNPIARISIKVPSITDLGTIAVGVVKAGADVITISGFEGGTGAASSSSISHAGLPLERGVSEVHQYLVVNGIRSGVRLRADGGIKSGMDIAKIMALGADEVSIGTPLLVAECCIFCRGCNKGKCPVGIATQDEEIQNQRFMRRRYENIDMREVSNRQRYEEARDGVIRYLECLAEHLRRILASLGLRHPRELVGRVDLLKQKPTGQTRWDLMDLSELLLDYRSDGFASGAHVVDSGQAIGRANREIMKHAHDLLEGRDTRLEVDLTLTNEDQAVGATLAGELARRPHLPPEREIVIRAQGYAGQGFGFAATNGMTLRLDGYANDSVAEGMSGTAKVVVSEPIRSSATGTAHLIGNTAAYGATGGRLFVSGSAGQRFGVRFSGGVLVCEGVGKYAFEYMTGGIGVVLGPCGPCVGSGMTGGEVWIYDPDGRNRTKLHTGVACIDVENEYRETTLKPLLVEHLKETKSAKSKHLLDQWDSEKSRFLCIRPLKSAD